MEIDLMNGNIYIEGGGASEEKKNILERHSYTLLKFFIKIKGENEILKEKNEFIKKGMKVLLEQNVRPENKKYIYISHIFRDELKKNNQLVEIEKLENRYDVKFIFT